ncbi:MAG TPA: hypothetical protein VK421_01065 [Pyrinomonadaceae bacterium]|nr:hypothetical protein [Pyrinomonadaceae bacterium]
MTLEAGIARRSAALALALFSLAVFSNAQAPSPASSPGRPTANPSASPLDPQKVLAEAELPRREGTEAGGGEAEGDEESKEEGGAGETSLPSDLINVPMDKLDEATKAKASSAQQQYFDYRIEGLKHRQSVLRWQLLSSRVIFVMVIFLVLAGVYFAGVQFHRGAPRKVQKVSTTEVTASVAGGMTESRDEVTQIEASLKGIKVSSPVLGVLILVISLMFFYLYLIYVYPINEIKP